MSKFKILALTILLFLLCEGIAMANIWKDWPDQHQSAAQFVLDNKLMFGYMDGYFRPWEAVTEKHVVRICKRANIRTDLDENSFYNIPATMGWVEENFLPGTVLSANKDEYCTRFRLAVMLERFGLKPGPTTSVQSSLPQYTAKLLNTWFEETEVTWNGVTRSPKLIGLGDVFVEEATKHKIPLWLALGQCWRESQWFTTGLSIRYNCGWGIKASPEKWGTLGNPPIVSGYGNYITVEESVRAYFRYMDLQVDSKTGKPLYRDLIDNHQWRSILNIYAPLFENNGAEHYAIVMKVKQWCDERGLKLFDEVRDLW